MAATVDSKIDDVAAFRGSPRSDLEKAPPDIYSGCFIVLKPRVRRVLAFEFLVIESSIWLDRPIDGLHGKLQCFHHLNYDPTDSELDRHLDPKLLLRRSRSGKWVAEIKHPKKEARFIWIGTYHTAEEAELAYNVGASWFKGSRALLNFPEIINLSIGGRNAKSAGTNSNYHEPVGINYASGCYSKLGSAQSYAVSPDHRCRCYNGKGGYPVSWDTLPPDTNAKQMAMEPAISNFDVGRVRERYHHLDGDSNSNYHVPNIYDCGSCIEVDATGRSHQSSPTPIHSDVFGRAKGLALAKEAALAFNGSNADPERVHDGYWNGDSTSNYLVLDIYDSVSQTRVGAAGRSHHSSCVSQGHDSHCCNGEVSLVPSDVLPCDDTVIRISTESANNSDDNSNQTDDANNGSLSSFNSSQYRTPDTSPLSNAASALNNQGGSDGREPPTPSQAENSETSVSASKKFHAVLTLSSGGGLAVLNYVSQHKHSSSLFAKILLFSAVGSNILGFSIGLVGVLLYDSRRPGTTASAMVKIGYVMSAIGFIALMCMALTD